MSQSNLSTGVESTIENSSMSLEDTVSFLTDDAAETEVIEIDEKKSKKAETDKTEDKKKSDKTEGSDGDESDDKSDDDSEDEVKSLEDELAEELDDDDKELSEELDLVTPVRRKEILAKYPTLFKDFPYLERAYYLEQKFTQLFPSLEDAEQASEKSQLLDAYEKDIMTGSTVSMMEAVRDGDKEAFAKLVDNYLPNLQRVDENAYYHTIGNVIKYTIKSMAEAGRDNQSDELLQAAELVNEYVFGTKKFTPPGRMSKDETTDKSSKTDDVSEREKAFIGRQLDATKGNVTTKLDRIIGATVDKNIDPNSSMTDYVKRIASKEVASSLDNLISKDTRFMSIYDKLWERAVKDNFSKTSVDRIEQAYLSKAKTLLPELIKRSRNEALKGLNKKVNSDTNEKDKKGPLPVGKARSSASSPNGGKNTGNAKTIVPKGVSTLDYLMSD